MEYKIWSLRESDNYDKQNFDYAESPDYVDSLWIYQGYPLKDDEKNKEWEEPTFTINYGDFPDYLGNDCSWCLCSEKLKKIMDNYANNADVIRWLPVKILNGETFKTYYALLIENYLEFDKIVNIEKSKKLKDGKVYLPHFIYSQIKDYDLFIKEDGGKSIFISQKLKDILEKENLTGLGFEDWKAS